MKEGKIPRYVPGDICPIEGTYLIFDNDAYIVNETVYIEKGDSFPEFPESILQYNPVYYFIDFESGAKSN